MFELVEHVFELGRDVEFGGNGLDADSSSGAGVYCFLEMGNLTTVDNYVGTESGHGRSDLAADPARGAGNQGPSVFNGTGAESLITWRQWAPKVFNGADNIVASIETGEENILNSHFLKLSVYIFIPSHRDHYCGSIRQSGKIGGTDACLSKKFSAPLVRGIIAQEIRSVSHSQNQLSVTIHELGAQAKKTDSVFPTSSYFRVSSSPAPDFSASIWSRWSFVFFHDLTTLNRSIY
jgi:hypothetical protein